MSTTHRVGIIGCGGTAKRHASAFHADERCDVVAVADLIEEKAEEFAQEHELPATIYTDYKKMLAEANLDIVNVCLWPQLHLCVCVDGMQAGVPAVHCEKPMAPTWAECKEMAVVAESTGAQLTFGHQRRFLPCYLKALELVQSGYVGKVEHLDVYIHQNVYDMGTHYIDLACMLNGDVPAKWVVGQVDARKLGSWFDVPFEFAAVGEVCFENGVHANIHSGDESHPEIHCGVRVTGDQGIVQLMWSKLRQVSFRDGVWHEEEGDKETDNPACMAGVVNDIVLGLEKKAKPQLHVEKALRTTELIFGLYESSRRRGRVDLPLDVDDSPFVSMLNEGVIGPKD